MSDSKNICSCGFVAKSPAGLVNHQRQDGCQKLRYRSLKQEGAFGEVGSLAYDAIADKVQCHICGQWFHFLSGHLRKHGVTIFDYKEQFGLNRNHALCGKENSRYRSTLCSNLRAEGKFNLMPPPPPHHYTRRLETLLIHARRERSEEEREKLSAHYIARLKRHKIYCIRCGHYFWIKVTNEALLANKKYCPSCRHIIKRERRKDAYHKRSVERR